MQLIICHDLLVGKDLTIECTVGKGDSMSPHTGVATWYKGAIIGECETGLHVIDEFSSQMY
jgi:hypothetical protein